MYGIDENKLKNLYLDKFFTLPQLEKYYNTSRFKIQKCLENLGILTLQIPYEKRISKEELENYYFNHSKEETLKFVEETYNIGSFKLAKILKAYNIVKSEELKNELRKNTLLKNHGVDNSSKVPNYSEKKKASLISKYGSWENYKKYLEEKSTKSKILKYGSLEKAEEIRKERYKSKLISLYGVDSPAKIKGYADKCKETKLNHFGNPNYNNIDKRKETNIKNHNGPHYNNRSKIVNTLKFHYGENVFKIISDKRVKTMKAGGEEAKKRRVEKLKNTNLQRYGIPFYCQSPEAKKTLKISKPNARFKEYLVSKGLKEKVDFETEFILDNFIYDFKIGDYLIEINPFATHNSSWGLFNNPKDKYYHKNKSIKAFNNNYLCICIWDWVDLEALMCNIMNNKECLVEIGEPKEYIYNYKLNQLVDKYNNDTVIIYDDGFTYRWI